MALTSLQIKLIRRLLISGTENKIAHAIEKIHPADLTVLFSELSPNETQSLINSLFLVSKAGLTLKELPEFMLPDILEVIDDAKLSRIISRLEPDDAHFLLEKIPESRWQALLEKLPQDKRVMLDKLLLYPKDSAGSLMTSKFVTIKSDMTVEQAIESIRHQPETDGVLYIYVVDDENRLVGVQSLRNLVLASPGTKVSSSMNQEVHFVAADTPQDKVAEIVSQYNLLAIPVIQESRELVGVITVDDVIDIVEEEATEDIYHLAGLSEVDRAMTPLGLKVRKRLPWMILNLITAALAVTAVGYFQASIEKVVALAVFMPIIVNVCGNGAIQSLTVISRSIALGELQFTKPYKAVLKESGNGLVIGLVCGVVMGAIGYLWQGNVYFGVVIFIAMMLSLFMAGFIGAVIPITFDKLNLDPAVGTSVLVTMFTDFLGFLFFLGLATSMLHYLV